ncbi:MAG: VWA domain-containing protein, partial [Anaerolineales bacterium]
NAPWQKLKSNLLLFLQLLIVAALILALARPFTWGEGSIGDLLIVVIDTSASMQATDLAPNRLEAAQDEVRQLLDEISPSTRVIIIEAGDRAELRLAGSLDRAAMNQALHQIQPGLGQADLITALELASAAAAGRQEADIVVFTDGGTPLNGLDSRYGRVQFVVLGREDDNQAIDLMTLERQPGGDFTAFVRVVNYASHPVTRRLTLSTGETLINAYDLELDAGQAQSIVAQGITADVVEARLVGEDWLPVDDRAWAVGGNQRPLQISLISQGNLFLEAALSLIPGVELSRLAPEDYDPEAQTGAAVDLTVLDGFVPAILPSGPVLFIAPSSSTDYFQVGPMVDQPEPRVVDPDHAIMRYVDVSQVEILDSTSLILPPRGRVLIAGDEEEGSTPLVAVIEQDQIRAAVIAFDLRRSDLPLQTAFPILLINLIAWLAPGASGGLPDQVEVGEVVTYAPPSEAESVVVVLPDGSQMDLDISNGLTRIEDTSQLGLYRLESDSGQVDYFAVNLFAPEESNIRPNRMEIENADPTVSSHPDVERSRLEWWPWLAGAALIILMLEWLVYQRAAVARVAAWVRGRMGRG